MSFTIEIKTEPETTIAYMPHKGPYNEIGGVMQQVLQQASQQGLMNEESRMLGLSYDDPDQVAPQDLRSDAAVIIAAGQKAQAPLQTKTIPAGDFAAVQYKGPYDGLKSAYNWMFGQWLPSSGRDIADYPCIEVYLNDPQSCEPKDYLTEIRIPLR